MNYYERHVGDYLKDTAHLSLLEHGVYTRLLDVYYTREQPFAPGEAARLVGARTKEEKAAVESVLAEFFVDGRQARCDREIGRYQVRAEHNQRVGKLGGRPRKVETRTEPEQNPPGYFREPEPNPPSIQEPVTTVVLNELQIAAPPIPAKPPSPAFLGDGNLRSLNGKSVIPLAATWELPEAWGVDAEALGWEPREVLKESEKFRQYWVAGKGADTRRSVKGWRQSWSNWLEKAAGYKR